MAQDWNDEVKVKVKAFEELTTRELYEILKVRCEVFVVEQGCHYQDMDDIDLRATHVGLWCDDKVVAYARVFKEEGAEAWHIGRVLTTRRKKNYGLRVMQEAVKTAQALGARLVAIEAQSYAVGFYEKIGFQVCSDEFMLEGILHKRMRLQV